MRTIEQLKKMVTEVDELNVAGFLGSKSAAESNTVDDAGRFTANSRLSVFLASPASNSNFNGLASAISPP